MFTVKNITARNAIPSGDRTVGMIVFVSDLGEYFTLTGGITDADWYSTVSETAATVANMTIYVDPAGNDTTGDGSIGLPYLTITKAYSVVPKLVNHWVHIIIGAGTYTAFPSEVHNDFGPAGQLTFDGGEPTAYSGPHTITTKTAYGDTIDVMLDLTVSGESWTPNEFKGKFLKITAGVWVESMHVVISNTADTVRIASPLYAISNGETFNIVQPPVTVNITPGETVSVKGFHSAMDLTPRIGIGSIAFASAASYFIARETVAVFPLCTFALGAANGRFRIRESNISPDNNAGGGWISAANAFVNVMSQYPGYVPFIVTCGGVASLARCEVRGSKARGLYVFGGMFFPPEGGASDVAYCCARQVYAQNDFSTSFLTILDDNTGNGVEVDQCRSATISGVHLEAGTNGIVVGPRCNVEVYRGSSTSANLSGHGIQVAAMGSYIARLQTADFTGVTGDIQFTFGGNSTVAWPASGGVAADSFGALVARV